MAEETDEAGVVIVIAALALFVALLVTVELAARARYGEDPSLAAPWSPANPPAAFRDDREPPCLCGERGAARRHRYHESSRWQERVR